MRARGIDISHWNGTFVYRGNIDFIIVKVSEGTAYQAYAELNWDEISKVPVRGAYHYFRTNVDPIAQADTFLDAISGQEWHFIAVDYEATGNTLDKQGAINLLSMMRQLRNVQNLPVLLYTSPYIYRDNVTLWDKAFDTFGLWLARWRNIKYVEIGDPTVGLSGDDLDRDWDIWQHSNMGTGEVYGVSSAIVDLNVYNGTVDDLHNYFFGGLPEMPWHEEPTMKKWYQSKTLWFSILFILTSVASLFGYGDWSPDTQLVEYVQLGMGVLMAILRAFTREGVEL